MVAGSRDTILLDSFDAVRSMARESVFDQRHSEPLGGAGLLI